MTPADLLHAATAAPALLSLHGEPVTLTALPTAAVPSPTPVSVPLALVSVRPAELAHGAVVTQASIRLPVAALAAAPAHGTRITRGDGTVFAVVATVLRGAYWAIAANQVLLPDRGKVG